MVPRWCLGGWRPGCCSGYAEVVAAAAAAECRGRVRQAHTMTGLAGGFAGDGAISWVADSLSRHGAAAVGWYCICHLGLGGLLGAGAGCHRGFHKRSQGAHLASARANPPVARLGARSFAPGAAAPGAGRVRGWRLRPARWLSLGRMGMPMCHVADGGGAGGGLRSASVADSCRCRTALRNDQEAVRQPGGRTNAPPLST